MSRKRKRRRKINKPSQQAEHQETGKTPDVNNDGYLQRKFLGASILVVVGLSVIGLGIREALKDTRKALVNTVENANFLSRIAVPEIDFDPEGNTWDQKRINSYFRPDPLDAERLRLFYELFDKKKDEFITDMSKIKDPSARNIRMITFLGLIIKAYYWLKQLPEKQMTQGSKEIDDMVYEINKILIPHGQWMTNFSSDGFNISIYKVGAIREARISSTTSTHQVPVITISDRVCINSRRTGLNRVLGIGGLYASIGRYVVLDETNARASGQEVLDLMNRYLGRISGHSEDTSSSEILGDFVASNAHHELMHAALHVIHGVSSDSRNVIVKKGDIRMSSAQGIHSNYVLREASYTWPNQFQLHELAGVGYGLMKSESAATVSSFNVIQSGVSGYRFAGVILFYELLNSPYTNDETKSIVDKALSGKPVSKEQLASVLSDLPIEELHHIGERMVKLAIYLTQNEETRD
jgi:hypothetical protein